MDLVGYGVVDLGFEELDDIVDSVMMLWIYCEAGVACPKLVDSIEVVIKHWKDDEEWCTRSSVFFSSFFSLSVV